MYPGGMYKVVYRERCIPRLVYKGVLGRRGQLCADSAGLLQRNRDNSVQCLISFFRSPRLNPVDLFVTSTPSLSHRLHLSHRWVPAVPGREDFLTVLIGS